MFKRMIPFPIDSRGAISSAAMGPHRSKVSISTYFHDTLLSTTTDCESEGADGASEDETVWRGAEQSVMEIAGGVDYYG